MSSPVGCEDSESQSPLAESGSQLQFAFRPLDSFEHLGEGRVSLDAPAMHKTASETQAAERIATLPPGSQSDSKSDAAPADQRSQKP